MKWLHVRLGGALLGGVYGALSTRSLVTDEPSLLPIGLFLFAAAGALMLILAFARVGFRPPSRHREIWFAPVFSLRSPAGLLHFGNLFTAMAGLSAGATGLVRHGEWPSYANAWLLAGIGGFVGIHLALAVVGRGRTVERE